MNYFLYLILINIVIGYINIYFFLSSPKGAFIKYLVHQKKYINRTTIIILNKKEPSDSRSKPLSVGDT